jgi:hypothetical protein
MPLPEIPDPPGLEEFLKFVFGTLGIPATAIIAIIHFAGQVKKWVDFGKSGLQATANGWRAVRRMRLATGVISVLVPAAQGLLLVFCYLAGNCLSILVHLDQGRWNAIAAAVRAEGFRLLEPAHLATVLRVDDVSGGYLGIGILCVLWSYRRAAAGRDAATAGLILALPAILLMAGTVAVGFVGLLAVAVMVFVALLGGDWSGFSGIAGVLVPWAITGALSLLYYQACVRATGGSGTLAQAWKARPAGQAAAQVR